MKAIFSEFPALKVASFYWVWDSCRFCLLLQSVEETNTLFPRYGPHWLRINFLIVATIFFPSSRLPGAVPHEQQSWRGAEYRMGRRTPQLWHSSTHSILLLVLELFLCQKGSSSRVWYVFSPVDISPILDFGWFFFSQDLSTLLLLFVAFFA